LGGAIPSRKTIIIVAAQPKEPRLAVWPITLSQYKRDFASLLTLAPWVVQLQVEKQ
jgi:hypothetical protein